MAKVIEVSDATYSQVLEMRHRMEKKMGKSIPLKDALDEIMGNAPIPKKRKITISK